MTEKEKMNELYAKYGLSPEDVFKHQHYKIITRSGIDKIQAKLNIEIDYELIYSNRWSEGLDIIFKVVATMGDKTIVTMGEASPSNTRQAYIASMAEKRGMSRAVLKLAGLYAEGFFGEDEADSFGDTVKTAKKVAIIKS